MATTTYNRYRVTQAGDIIDLFKNKKLRPSLQPNGYEKVWINMTNGIRKFCYVHRVVWEYFFGRIPKGLTVNHCDEDKTNNSIDNLCLMTIKENNNWGTRNKRISQTMRAKRFLK